MRLLLVTALAALLELSEAVDRKLFRTCDQGSFCRRFRAWQQRPSRDVALWSVVDGSRQDLPQGGFAVKVQHREESEPHLMLTVNPYEAGLIRLRLSEIDPLHPRHMIPPGDAAHEPPPASIPNSLVQSLPGRTEISFVSTFGDQVSAVLSHTPLRLETRVNGKLVQTLNARNFFNFERYRRQGELRPPDANRAIEGITLDAALNPANNDTSGFWEESFHGHTDKKPRGPASFGVDVSFEGNVPAVFGLPEHATKASLPFYKEPYRFFNLDVFEYELDEPMALYGTIPLLWAIHRGAGEAAVSGFLWLNPSETFVQLERNEEARDPVHSWWVSESGVMDAVVLVGSTPSRVSAQFHAFTGHAPLHPLWALGKHQCRWNYMSEKDVATVDSTYDAYDLPYDVIWLDIEHTDGKAYFSWHKDQFPTPQNMTAAISAKNRKMVLVVDPHMKKSDSFEVYKEIKEKGLFVKKVDWKTLDDPSDSKPQDWVDEEEINDPEATVPPEWSVEDDGEWVPPKVKNPAYKGVWKPRQLLDLNSPRSDFEGWCWPGTSSYPDFTDPKMREYWGSRFALDKYTGTNADTYIWNDMNEPSVFNAPEVTMPRDAVHPNGNVEHRDVHNMYGYYVHRATFEGLQARSPSDRPFVLTRSFFVGSHKYSAIWTGDNTAAWDHIAVSMPMIGALNLGGQSLVGADVGGFFKHPDGQMVTRWYQLAALTYGFFRNHAHLETPRREPYMYDEEVLKRTKAALQLRYRMLPLWYTLFQEYHALGHPVTRHLWWNFLEDPYTHVDEDAVEHELMIGDVALVYGVHLQDQAEANVYLPRVGGWYDLYTGDFVEPGHHKVQLTMDTIPAYYRGGAIVPLKSRVRRSASCMRGDPLTLAVYLDPRGKNASGRVYIDDYSTKAFEDGRSFLDVSLEFQGGSLFASAVSGEALLPSDVSSEVERVELFGLDAAPAGATLLDASGRRELSVSRRGKHCAVVKIVPALDLRLEKWSVRLD